MSSRLGHDAGDRDEVLVPAIGASEDGPIVVDLQLPVTTQTGPRVRRAIENALADATASGRSLRLEGPPEALRFAGVVADALLAGPETVQVNLSNACNLDCRFCWNHSPLLAHPRSPRWKQQRIDPGLMRRALTDARRLQAGHVLFSGRGEPFTHPEIWSFIGLARDLELPLTIETNLLLADAERLLAEAGPLTLVVNISAGTPEGFARIHPAAPARSFHRLRTQLEVLTSHPSSPGVVPTFVIYRESYAEIPAMVGLAAGAGLAQVFFKMAEPSPELPDLSVPEEERAALRDVLDRAEAVAFETGVQANLAHLRYQLRDNVRPQHFTRDLYRRIGCFMGWYYTRITIAGEVHFCCRDKLVDSMTSDHGLHDIWVSAKYRSMRRIARAMRFDRGRGFLDSKCFQCPNFAQNMKIAEWLGEGLESA